MTGEQFLTEKSGGVTPIELSKNGKLLAPVYVAVLLDEFAEKKQITKGIICGTCEKEIQLYNVIYKKWYCLTCKKYL